MKTTSIRSCQSCGVEFIQNNIAYYVPIDNNIVCFRCSLKHYGAEQRLVEIENYCSPPIARYNALVEILKGGGITPTHAEEKFLLWFSTWDNETSAALRGLLEKCLGVGGNGE